MSHVDQGSKRLNVESGFVSVSRPGTGNVLKFGSRSAPDIGSSARVTGWANSSDW